MKQFQSVLALFVLALFLYSCDSQPKVYEWRGENRLGIYQEDNLLKEWPKNGPELVWEYDQLGYGYGAPVFTEDRMYILGEIDSIGYLSTFDLDGNLLWKKDYGTEWTKSFRGSRSTPTVVDDLLYVCSGLGDVSCFNAQTGNKIWTKELKKDFQGEYTMHGHSESLIIEEDKVFFMPGGTEFNVVALNRFSGDVIWKSKGMGERPAYNAPRIIKLASRNVLVQFSAYNLMGFDTKTGELLWAYAQDNLDPEKRKFGIGDTHSNTVLYEDGFIYYVAGDGNCGVKLELSEDGSNIKEVWRNDKFDGFMGGVLSLGDYIYSNGTRKPTFMSVHKETGEIANTLKIGSGSVIAADNLLYYYNQKGKVMLIDPNPTAMKVLSEFKITKGQKEHFAHPVINDGKLYIRHGGYLAAYNIKTQ